MKPAYLILMLVLSGCVNVEFPGLIADTAKVSKDAYGAIVGKKETEEPAKPAKPAAAQSEYISHAYIGQENQTVTEIKQLCVKEAADKLFMLAGKEIRYSVAENTIATVNNTVVANCRLVIEKIPADSAVVTK